MRLLDVLALFSLLLGLAVLRSVRRAHIRAEYSVSWLAAAAALALLSRATGPLDRAAHWLGLAGTGVLLPMVVMMVFLVVFYRFSVILSELKDTNVALTQRLAILEYRLRHETPPPGAADAA